MTYTNIVRVLTVLVIAAALCFFIKLTDAHDKAMLAINYCWDSNGQHYVAPNEACNH